MNHQHLIDALTAQRDSAMNQLAQAVAMIREKDDVIAEKDAIIERHKAAAVSGHAPPDPAFKEADAGSSE